MAFGKGVTRRAADCGEQHGGLEGGTGHAFSQPHETDITRSEGNAQRQRAAERLRVQRQCRDYWTRVYGQSSKALGGA